MSSIPSSTNNHLECSICERNFTRNEHLKRHLLTHTQSRPFECVKCGKSFVRKDALGRHQITHEIQGPNLLEKKARACSSCASSKVRCSGEFPACARCLKRGTLPCCYPVVTRSENDESGQSIPGPLDNPEAGDTARSNMIPQKQPELREQQSNAQSDPPPNASVSMMWQSPRDAAASRPWDLQAQPTINWLSPEDLSYTDALVMQNLEDDPFLSFLAVPYDTSLDQDLSQQSLSQNGPPSMSRQGTASHYPAPRDTPATLLDRPVTTPGSSVISNPDERIEGEFYVDGQPARLPRVKRRRMTLSTPHVRSSASAKDQFRLNGLNATFGDYQGDFQLSGEVYREMVNAFELLCGGRKLDRQSASGFRFVDKVHVGFDVAFTGEFASKGVLERMITSYVESFHPLLPILHFRSLHLISWQLALAVSAVGPRFVDADDIDLFTKSIDEFVRRVLYVADGSESWLPGPPIESIQMKLLYNITSAYSDSDTFITRSHSLTKSLTDYCLNEWHQQAIGQAETDVSEQWNSWIHAEARRRTGYAIWLVDCMLAIDFQQPARLNIENDLPQLPCCEELWNAPDAGAWHALSSSLPKTDSMSTTLYRLYTGKSLSPHLGEFGRVLLVHGLFRRMWAIESFMSHPLSQWTPTALKELDDTIPTKSDIWPPSLPLFAKWRNSTCDCLDVLHWSANAKIGAASGMEHPTVLHLHFARVVLLTPHRDIVHLAMHVARMLPAELETSVSSCKNAVRKWAVQDQFKARLAMIHAGVMFWHVRRYSSNAFYEPSSVAISTLALWAFSTFSQHIKIAEARAGQTRNPPRDGGDSELEEHFYDIILLDRPTDDELVQQFVREGHKMRANMNGVGDLYDEGASVKVLVEGRKLLRTISNWSSCRPWIKLIDALIPVCRRR